MIFDPTVIDIDTQSIDKPFEYLEPFMQQIENVNIKDFDYEIFKNYIEDLTETEFEDFWDSAVIDLLRKIDETYLTVDLDEFENSDTETKKTMFLKYIEFLMYVLPYKIVFAKYLKKQFPSMRDLYLWLSQKNLSLDLSELIENLKIVNNNMLKTVKQLSETDFNKKTKSEMDLRLEKITEFIEQENKFIEYFADLVADTEDEKLIDLILKYYENEYL